MPTKFLSMLRKRKSLCSEVDSGRFNSHKLVLSSSLKYLGVLLDEHLSWNQHISDLCLKLTRANSALSKIRHYVPVDILLKVYHAIFDSHLSYACQLWAQSETVNTRRVLILQKYGFRIISFSPPRSPSAPIFKSFKILTIFDLVKTLNIFFVHQHLNFKLPRNLCNSALITLIITASHVVRV